LNTHQHIANTNKPKDISGSRPPFFQPKLNISKPNDVHEQQANSMTDDVMRMNTIAQNSFFKPANNTIQRKCQACEEEEKHVHRKEADGAKVHGSSELNNYVNSLSSSGQQMSQNSRQFFEPRFGHDFSNVKIHTDTVAAKSAQSINALAYTTGHNIVFNSGQYAPDSDSGKRLIAHELTHVVQQSNDSIKLHGNIGRIIQRGEGGQETNTEAVDTPGGDAAWFESAAICAYYDAKVCLSRREKDEQLLQRLLSHFSDQPDARRHLYWYRYGGGADYTEDVGRLFRQNPSVQRRIASLIAPSLPSGTTSGTFSGTTPSTTPIRQQDYDVDNWLNANGNIDEVTWELTSTYTPHGRNTFTIGIRDPYQWHPLENRPTQCIHQAMERLKTAGAAEYMTVGSATITLNIP